MAFKFGLPRLVLGYELPERRKIDDDTIVEIDRPQWRDKPYMIKEDSDLFDKGFLCSDQFALRAARIRPPVDP